MGDFKDFNLDLKKVKNNTKLVGPNTITIFSLTMCTCILSDGCPSYGGDRGCGPTTSANSRVIGK